MGVAVRRRLGADFKTDNTTRAAAIVDDHRLPPGFTQALPQQTRHQIAGAASDEGRDETDGAIGVIACTIGRARGTCHARHGEREQ